MILLFNVRDLLNTQLLMKFEVAASYYSLLKMQKSHHLRTCVRWNCGIFAIIYQKPSQQGRFLNYEIDYPIVTLPLVAVPLSAVSFVDEPVRVIGFTVPWKQ